MITEFIFNPESVGSFCHSASIAEHNSCLVSAWYAYSEKEYENGKICFAHFDEGRKSWLKPMALFESLITKSCGNPVLFSDRVSNKLYMFFVVLSEHYWTSAQVYKTEYLSENKTWSVPMKLELPEGIMVRHRPLQVESGEIFIPAYNEKTNRSLLYKAMPPFNDWEILVALDDELIQGDLLRYDDQQWHLYLRPTDSASRYVYKAVSPDSGKTFSTIIRTDLNCPLSGIASIKLSCGKILICHNDTEEFKRSPLSLSIANEGNINFHKIIDIDDSNFEISYPTLIERENKSIALLYTYNRRMIKSVYLDETFRSQYDI